jgi:uncharacterized membrane protein YdfJ with MMPL/SSD domain
VLVPCTVVLLGRWNWWPSKLTIDAPEADAVSADADALGLAGPSEPTPPATTGDSAADTGSPRHT